MTMTWTFEGYWTVVLGAYRDPSDVVREFDLEADRRGLDEWLGQSEAVSASAGCIEIPGEWAAFHARALEMLIAAAESLDAKRERDEYAGRA